MKKRILKKSLVISIMLLFMGMGIAPSTGFYVVEQFDFSISDDGNTLYVGGDGPGNYTRIQDAIDNASDGDTVFVYDDLSPYNENIIINKRIMLVGEDKNTTIINDSESGTVVTINADQVNVSGFTIQGYKDGLNIISHHNTISNNIFSSGLHSIILYHSFNNEIFLNIINNSAVGIKLRKSSANKIYNNLISNNSMGILVWYSSLNNQIMNNTIKSNHNLGIRLSTTSATVSGNNFSNNSAGLVLSYCSDNFIKNNCFINDGLYVHESYRNIVENNTINEKPLLYLEEKSNMIIDDSAGQVFLVSCNNITVRNLEFLHACMSVGLVDTVDSKIEKNIFSNVNYYAITIEYSENIAIENNTIENPIEYMRRGIYTLHSHHNTIKNNVINGASNGIHLYGSNSNMVFGNNISNNKIGIYLLEKSSNNTINNNKIYNNQYTGVIIGGIECEKNTVCKNYVVNNKIGIKVKSNQNLIFENSITNNDLGINITSHSFNKIYHNNFINNNHSAYDNGNNTWDDGEYGNYWDDYNGTDDDGDGIGDTPYNIHGGSNQDRYPLMHPYLITVYVDDDFNSSTPGWGFDHFDKIQDGIDAVAKNGTVYAYNGIYYENVKVNKSITLIGENRDSIIDGGGSGNVVYISVDWVNISGFTIRNSGYPYCGIDISSNYNNITGNTISNNNNGIYLYSSSNNNITGNNFSYDGYGLYLYISNRNTISSNTISNGYRGIFLKESSDNTIYSNNISVKYRGIYLTDCNSNTIIDCNINLNNDYSYLLIEGLYLYSSNDNIITSNNIRFNGQIGTGMLLTCSDNNYISKNNVSNIGVIGHDIGSGIYLHYHSDSNTVTSNNITKNYEGIKLSSSSSENIIIANNITKNRYAGISLEKTSFNTISNNSITKNRNGIYFYESNSNIIKGNSISNNDFGIRLIDTSNNNNITGNNIISNNDYGIVLWFPVSNNTIYNNYFNNTNNVYDGGNNIWNISKTLGTNIIGGPYLGGNYWNDYTGVDLDGDGLGDTDLPYNSSGNIHNGGDWLPLVNSPPYTPSNPIPPDGATGVYINTDLSWNCSDPDPGDTLVYDVYLEANDPTPDTKVADDISENTFDPGTLEYGTTYWWQIIAKDNHGAVMEGPIWRFTTTGPTPLPDLDCGGSLSWTDVEPGSTVTGSFTVKNIGEPESELGWEIIDWPKDWGNWTFTPLSGNDLTPEAGPVTVNVSVVAPDEKNKNFSGNIMIVNKENSSDYCTIRVYLSTPENKAFNFNFNLLEQKIIKNKIN